MQCGGPWEAAGDGWAVLHPPSRLALLWGQRTALRASLRSLKGMLQWALFVLREHSLEPAIGRRCVDITLKRWLKSLTSASPAQARPCLSCVKHYPQPSLSTPASFTSHFLLPLPRCHCPALAEIGPKTRIWKPPTFSLIPPVPAVDMSNQHSSLWS